MDQGQDQARQARVGNWAAATIGDALMPTISVIINHTAGTSAAVETDAFAARLRAAGYEPTITIARDGSEILAAAKRAHSENVDVVVAGGGDGTINCVAAQIAGTDTALGVLPLGTLNHFAKDLGIPLDVELAMQTILDGRPIAVDVGEVNGKLFLNNSSIGIYPDMVKEREAGQHRLGKSKWEAFFWACLKVARRYPFIDVQLKVDGDTLARHTPFVFVGNNAYTIDGFDLGGRKTLTGGRLSVYVSQRTGRMGLLGFAVRALFGRLRQADDFDAMLTEQVDIQTRRKSVRVSTDGEVTTLDLPLRYRIRPGALRVIVPASVDAPTSADPA
jgi:YegS/Rv2252/BmrU family lipid kinase